MLCKFRNNQLKSHFFYKIPNIKKHVTFFENLIADLKSSRKNASETVFILTRTFHKYFNIGKLHCEGRQVDFFYFIYLFIFFFFESPWSSAPFGPEFLKIGQKLKFWWLFKNFNFFEFLLKWENECQKKDEKKLKFLNSHQNFSFWPIFKNSGPKCALSDYSSGWNSYHTEYMNGFSFLCELSYVFSEYFSG